MEKTIILKIISFLLPMFLVFVTETLFPLIGFPKFKCFILTCFILYAFYFLFLGLTKKSKIANLILVIFVSTISIISALKMAFMDEPLLVSDILFLGNASEIGSIIKSSFFITIKPTIPNLLFQIFFSILIILFGNKLNVEINNLKLRLTSLISSLIILILLFAPIESLNKFILVNFFDINKRVDYNRTDCYAPLNNYYQENGSLLGMYGMVLENRNTKPNNYDEKLLTEILSSTKGEKNNTFGKSNIIVIFSESFWNIDQLEDLKFTKPVVSNFNKLKEEGLLFDMISPVYGGISANVEFEFLTGATMTYFTPGYVPYMQLYTNKTYYNRPSIINELKNAGYKTFITHSGGPKMFNCSKFYDYLKVDEKKFLDQVGPEHKKGPYVSEEYNTDLAIKTLEEKDKDERIFYMALTMQAHMPFNGESYEKYDVSIAKSNLNNKLNQVILNYAQGIYDADQQLARLYEYIKNYAEPTIIVFYGDHLPYLSSGSDDVLKELAYFNTSDEKQNLYRKYNTQSLILANYDLTELKNNKPAYLSPDLLSTYILNNMDLKLSNYYEWLYTTIDTIGASNNYLSIDQKGNLYYNNELTGAEKELYNLRKMMQYKFFIKR